MPETKIMIGLDEAGYGPNLGPLVIAATCWEVPQDLSVDQFWDSLADMVSQQADRSEQILHVADSKLVYSSSRSIASLERSVLSLLCQENRSPNSLSGLIQQLFGQIPSSFAAQPWYADLSLLLPMDNDEHRIQQLNTQLNAVMETSKIRFHGVRVDLVCPEPFNEICDQLGTKGALLTQRTFQLMRSICPKTRQKIEIYADKQGGRSRYLPAILEAFPDQVFWELEAGQTRSRYQSDQIQILLETKGEKYLPIAWASMVAKYLRELCMEVFNQYWRDQLPEIKPTKGYPQDAKRFRQEIEPLLKGLEIDERILWRNR